MKWDFDFDIDLGHVLYSSTIAITWLIMAFWAEADLNAYYITIPAAIATFITVSYWIGGIAVLFAVIILVIAFDIV